MSTVTFSAENAEFRCVAADAAADPVRVVIGGTNGVLIYSILEVEDPETGFDVYQFEQSERNTTVTANGVDFNSTTGIFIYAAGKGNLGRSVGGENWELLDAGVDEDLYDICYVSGTIWVAVGEDGTILRSTDDGASWAAATVDVAFTENLYAIAVNSTTLVVVGADGAVGTSTDSGANWTNQKDAGNIPLTDDLWGVCYGPTGKWSIVGDDTAILQWDENVTFAIGTADVEVDLRGVAWTGQVGGLMLAAGSGAVTLSSTTGLTWLSQESGSTSSMLWAVEYLDSRFIAVGDNGKICYSATGAGVRAYDTFKPISETLRAYAFCQSGAYMNYGNISEWTGAEWVNYPTRIWSAAPGTVNDFDVAAGFGAWTNDLPGDGAILEMASIEGGWVIARSNQVDLMTDGGSLDLPWNWNGDYGQGLRIISNFATFGGAAFGVCEDGLIYRANYNSIARLPGFFDLTEFDDFNPGSEEIQAVFDPQTQKIVIFRPASPYRLFFVDDETGSVTEFALPSWTESGVEYTPRSVFVTENETSGIKIGYGTEDDTMSTILTLDFEYDTAAIGFDTLSVVADTAPFHGELVTGCFRMTALGRRGEINKIVLRTNADPDSTVRPKIAMAVKQEPDDDWVWVREGTHPGTIAVNGGAGSVIGTGTAWSHLVAGGGSVNPVTVPWLVEKLTRVYDGSTGLDLTYTKASARAINLTVTPAANDVYAEAGPFLPYVYGEDGDFLLLDDGTFIEISTVDTANTISPVFVPSDYDGAAEYIETKEIPEGDEKGDGKLLYGLEDGIDQVMIKIVMLVPAGNDAKWAKISGIEIGYKPTGSELKTDGG